MYIKNELSEKVYKLAIECGYDKCGIIDISATSDYKNHLDLRIGALPESQKFYNGYYAFADMKRDYPWAKSIIICGYWYGKYEVPGTLKNNYGRSYLMDGRLEKDCAEYKTRVEFEEGLNNLGLKFHGDRLDDITAFRFSALKAGLGTIRKNNFFYTEKGSWIYFDAWVVAEEMELICDTEVKQCPDTCNLCQNACATNALCNCNTMDPYKCTAFISSLNSNELSENPVAGNMKQWIYGCDDCQNACPFNAKVEETEQFPNLAEMEKYLTLEGIIRADYEVLRKIVQPKFWYIEPDELWKFKVNALNAINNLEKLPDDFNELIAIAKADEHLEVRNMALWVFECRCHQISKDHYKKFDNIQPG